MVQTESPVAAAEHVLACALLQLGSNTRAARLYKQLGLSGRGADAPDALAAALGFEGAERAARVARARDHARQALAAAAPLGLGVLEAAAPDYPPLLGEIPDPPMLLWTLGDRVHLRRHAVAIVGSRHASHTGLAVARQLGRELAEAGLVVVSGLARGIDAAAHRGALEGGGVTVAVLGNGLASIYPPEHAALAREIAASGIIVTEYPPAARPHALHFPLRNRIISGLSLAVVVVEASEKSGSLITARAALEQGRDVLAVPGNVASGRYRGGHALIKDGARLVETVEDVLAEIGWTAPVRARADKSFISKGLLDLIPAGDTVSPDELVQRTGRPAPEVLAELGTLEVAGRVRRLTSGGVTRT